MTIRVSHWFKILIQSYLFIISTALIAALIFPSRVVLLAPFATLFLQIVFFFTALKLDLRKVWKDVGDVKLIVVSTIFMLIVLPAGVFLIANQIVPSLAIPLLLLAAMPTGMTAPLLAEVVGGKPGTALVLTVTTSLFAPITIPLVIGFFASTAVTVSVLTMFWSLVKIILIPFALAQIIRFMLHEKIKTTYYTFKPLSLILLGLLIAGVVAKQAELILAGFGQTVIIQLIVLTVFIIFLMVVGYYVAYWRSCQSRLTVSVAMTFMNFTLAIFLAGSFFNDPNALLATVLIIFPWSLLVIPYKKVIRKYVCPIK